MGDAMSKTTISSLVRQAARSEPEFFAVIEQVFQEETADRIAEFFDRLNIPRSVEGENLAEPLPTLESAVPTVRSYEDERIINQGIQKYMDRHLKKLKWHAQRPTMEGSRNVLLLMRQGMAITDIRIRRLQALLKLKDELNADEWSTARDIMNKGFMSFRHYLQQFGGPWIDAAKETLDRADLEALVGRFHELIDAHVQRLDQHRGKIEARRNELSVLPDGFPPVKPPIYFGGDLLGRGPWKQFWVTLEDRSHHFREALS
jgi:hypothetical protein